MATMAIMGALHTSASDVMEAHANLLPIELTMDRVCHWAALCLTALLESHPLFKPVHQSARRFLKRHRLPLHHLFHAFNVQPQDCETLMPPTCPPNEVSTLQLQVADTREESREEDEGDKADVRVYLDGSGIEGMAGAAAVLFRDGQEIRSLWYQLGPLMHHTMYEAEVVGVLLATELIRKEHAVCTATIQLDSQAVVQVLGSRSVKPAQSLLNSEHEACHEWLTDRRHRNRQLTIGWVSRHDGVEGNERADNEAKTAACEGSSPEDEPPEALQGSTLLSSLSALGGAFKETLQARWKSLWAKSP